MTSETSGRPRNLLTKKWAVLAMLLATPVFFLFAYLGDAGRGRAAAVSVGVIILAARARWDLRREVWYWTAIAVVAACHIPLLLFVSWTEKNYPGYALLPIAVLDFAAIYGAIKLVEKAARARA